MFRTVRSSWSAASSLTKRFISNIALKAPCGGWGTWRGINNRRRIRMSEREEEEEWVMRKHDWLEYNCQWWSSSSWWKRVKIQINELNSRMELPESDGEMLLMLMFQEDHHHLWGAAPPASRGKWCLGWPILKEFAQHKRIKEVKEENCRISSLR